MRRVARILFHLSALVSASLFLIAIAGWGLSYRRAYNVGHGVGQVLGDGWDLDTYVWHATVSRGGLWVGHYWLEDIGDPPPASKKDHWSADSDPAYNLRAHVDVGAPLRRVSFAGFLFLRWDDPLWSRVDVVAPLPFVAFLLALLPLADVLLILRRRRREHRVAAGLCVRCGYDLRATPEKCPEYGAAPAANRETRRAGAIARVPVEVTSAPGCTLPESFAKDQ